MAVVNEWFSDPTKVLSDYKVYTQHMRDVMLEGITTGKLQGKGGEEFIAVLRGSARE